MSSANATSVPLKDRLQELIRIFGRLGCIGFGGPQAHIAMQNDEAVVRREWLTQDQFGDGLAICEMLPGPASTQMGIYLGYIRAGQIGALVAGIAFIAPAFLIVIALSWAYFRFQALPQLEAIFFGISPVMIAIILGFCWKLGKKSIHDWIGIAIAIAAGLAVGLGGLSPLLAFVIAGATGLIVYRPQQTGTPQPIWMPLGLMAGMPLAVTSTEVLALSSFWGLERIGAYFWPLLSFFFRTGTFIFGGGLVIIPLLEFQVVDNLHWLTRNEFLNGIAIGQLSPGPVVLTAAFVGFKVAGVLGSLVASIGIFTPSFLFIMAGAPLLLRLRQNLWVQAFLKAVRPAVLGAIAAAAIPLTQTAIFQQPNLGLTIIAGAIALISLAALIRFKLPTWQLVLAGGLIGLLIGIIPGSGLI
ncbi:chromate efflux transporter [Oscillatoria sp. CS-180]|uniref:chromate efflux transporter n=1 Tax=Oscillatoria sp. CS-180 TaxID=3021720 RepID=UPI00232D1593|nr:chromate efflux transporter [Oscillatoria sp. CS-180]MDB9526941.1 chromate efflux transporter [Oscillatoria sp. CS-180]